jgi:tRNA(His) guanylyltransferase
MMSLCCANASQQYEDKPSAIDSTPDQPFGKSSDEKKKPLSKTQLEKERKRKQKARVVVEHVDIIKDKFWQENPWILG